MSIAFRYSFEDCFTLYLENRRESEIDSFKKSVEEQVVDGKIATNDSFETLVSYQAMTEGLFYEVFNEQNQMIYDSTALMQKISTVDGNKQELQKLGFTTDQQTFQSSDGETGKIITHYKIGYKKGEFQFQERLDNYIVAAEATMVIIAFIVSLFFSKTLTNGLRAVSHAAHELLHHNLNVRMPVKGLSEEMQQVAFSFNELAESLSYQEKLRKQFSSDLAHELRTPIATLRSQIEAFMDGIWEPTKDRLEQVHGELMRLIGLVNDLEKLMAAENPNIQLQMDSQTVSDRMNCVYNQYQRAFAQKKIEFRMEKPTYELYFLADKNRFVQIVTNLLQNSLKYTKPGGSVTIGAFENNNMVYFYVKDTGVGIPKDDIPHVFERFYRGDKSRDRKTGGIGIGLSITKALVVAHGGTIEIESEINKGTKVIVCFKKVERLEG